MKSSNFSPNMHEFWRQAAAKTVHLQCGKGQEGRKAAVTLRHRLYQLRVALKREGHEMAAAYDRVTIQLREVSGNWMLIGNLADTHFDELLQSNGIIAPSAPDLPEIES